MKNKVDKPKKEQYQPVEILIYNYNCPDLISTSNGYDPFFGEEDPLIMQTPKDDTAKNA